MRTTLTLERDVSERIRQEMRRTGDGMKKIVNEALRSGLGLRNTPSASGPFKVEAHAFGLRSGFDPDRMNQLLDELEAEEVARKLGS